MRAFIVACTVGLLVAAGAGAVLGNFVQQTASAAFAEPGVRI